MAKGASGSRKARQRVSGTATRRPSSIDRSWIALAASCPWKWLFVTT
jgi:hypothetical protein